MDLCFRKLNESATYFLKEMRRYRLIFFWIKFEVLKLCYKRKTLMSKALIYNKDPKDLDSEIQFTKLQRCLVYL